MAPLPQIIHLRETCPDEPFLASGCISSSPFFLVTYAFLFLGLLGFVGLFTLHLLRKYGWTKRLKRLYHEYEDELDAVHVFLRDMGGRVGAGTSSFLGGERWVDLEMRARWYSPTPAAVARGWAGVRLGPLSEGGPGKSIDSAEGGGEWRDSLLSCATEDIPEVDLGEPEVPMP